LRRTPCDRQTGGVISRAVLHIDGALPVIVDLRALPEPTDVNLMCTNMRTVDGKKPSFIDHSDSWFVIPLAILRFIELPPDALEMAGRGGDQTTARSDEPEALMLPAPIDEGDLEPDEAFLKRIRDI
jgi:hypothetical protein